MPHFAHFLADFRETDVRLAVTNFCAFVGAKEDVGGRGALGAMMTLISPARENHRSSLGFLRIFLAIQQKKTTEKE